MAEKTLIEQVGDGIANALGIETKPRDIQTVGKGKGVLIPKLSPIPTVKTGKNRNAPAQAKEQQDNMRLSKLDSRIARSEQDNSALREQVAANSRRIANQKQWIVRKLNEWKRENALELQRATAETRKKMACRQMDILCQQANARVAPPAPTKKPLKAARAARPAARKVVRAHPGKQARAANPVRPAKKKATTASPGRRYSIRRKPVKKVAKRRAFLKRAARHTPAAAVFRAGKRVLSRKPLRRKLARPTPAGIALKAGKRVLRKKPLRNLRRKVARRTPAGILFNAGKKALKRKPLRRKMARFTPAGIAFNAGKRVFRNRPKRKRRPRRRRGRR